MARAIVCKKAFVSKVTVEAIPDSDPDTSYLDQRGFEDRKAAFERGAFGFVGVKAKASVAIPENGSCLIQTLHSGGLWGIESDSDESYIRDVGRGELNELEGVLTKLGIPSKAAKKAIKDAEWNI